MHDQEKLKNHPEIIGWSKVTCKNRFYDLLKKHSNIKEYNNANIDMDEEEEPFDAISSVLQFKKKDFFSTRINEQIQAEAVKLSNTKTGKYEVFSLSVAIEKAHEQDCDLLQLNRKSKVPICRFKKKYSFEYISNTVPDKTDNNNERDREITDLTTQLLKFIETDEFSDNERLIIRFRITGKPRPEEFGITPQNIRVITHRAIKKINKWMKFHEIKF